LLSKIIDIRTKLNTPEILIIYNPETDIEIQKRDGAINYVDKTTIDNNDILKANYLCINNAQRDILFEEIFIHAVSTFGYKIPQSFIVSKELFKIGFKGKLQERTVKITSDSILNCKKRKIKREIPFSSISSIIIDADNEKKISINFLSNGNKKNFSVESLIPNDVKECTILSILKYRKLVEIDSFLYLTYSVDSILDKIFSSFEFDSVDEDWKAVISISHTNKQLYRTFSSLIPNEEDKVIIDDNFSEFLETKLNINKIKQDEIILLLKILDPERRGYFTYDDFCFAYIVYRKQFSCVKKKIDFKNKINEKNKVVEKNKIDAELGL
jgi:hypothetical protein